MMQIISAGLIASGSTALGVGQLWSVVVAVVMLCDCGKARDSFSRLLRDLFIIIRGPCSENVS